MTWRRPRPAARCVSAGLALFVFTLFCFPNYCDFCSYRAVTLYQEQEPPPAPAGATCCRSKEPEPARRGTADPPSPADHDPHHHKRVRYCIGSTLATIGLSADPTGGVRVWDLPGRLPPSDPTFARHVATLDHKDTRAPPA